MTLASWIGMAKRQGASDLHLEGGMPVTVRIRGTLHMVGEPVAPQVLLQMTKDLLNPTQWATFVERRSYDLSKTIERVRCRINVLQSSRGVGMAIRLLSSFEASLVSLNLHPDLLFLLEHRHGLILVSGPTGSGKSTTIAGLIQELNSRVPLHIVTIENPIEYAMRPKKSLIRQREVGRDTPSFEQALLDSLREDPDVIVVGEMRHPETMRLTIGAAETGHLVFSTVHSSSTAEALQRVVSAFPAEIQNNVCAQLADCLVAVVCQRLVYREEVGMQVPECEILTASHAVRSMIRHGHFGRIATAIETGGEDNMWTFERYRRWLDQRTDWSKMELTEEHDYDGGSAAPEVTSETLMPSLPTQVVGSSLSSDKPKPPKKPMPAVKSRATSTPSEEGVLVLDDEENLEDIVAALKKF